MSKSDEKVNPLSIEDATDKLVRKAFLFDFYGELLNEHQRNVYQTFVCDNLSLSEIAQENGVSRQSIHDLIKRCDSILEQYESKLHLYEKFQVMKQDIATVQELALNLKDSAVSTEIREICSKLLSEL